ncbi:MAG: hypothetical protein JOY92_03515 [Verrucomicrobia bacterium]|nr:hypothetical protein [Verrucomicrobiota bacterium]
MPRNRRSPALQKKLHSPRLCLAGFRLLVCLLALMPMWDLSKNFCFDWYNHLWMSAYSGRFLWTHGFPPAVLNTAEAVGLPHPLFYASTFHTLLGGLGRLLGMALAFRLAALLLLMVQFSHVERAAREAGVSRFVAFIVATAVSWQVYLMNSLYERGDLTEFTALVFLTCALSCLLVLCLRIASEEKDTYGLIATGAFYGLTALTHPLTGFYGGILIAAFGSVALLVLKSRKLFLFGVLNALALGCLLSPWLYVVHRFGKLIRIADPSANSLMFQGLFVTTVRNRLVSVFSPISGSFFTAQSLFDSSYEASARASVALLAFAVFTLAILSRCPKRRVKPARLLCSFLGLSYLTLLICLLVICVPKCSSLFGNLFDIMQYSSRLAAYVNLSLVLCSLCLFGLLDWEKLQSQRRIRVMWKWAGIGALLLAAVGLGSKMISIQASNDFGSGTKAVEALLQTRHWATRAGGYWLPGNPGGEAMHVSELPAMFYGRSDYDVRSAFSTDFSRVNGLPVRGAFFRSDKIFGEVKSIEFSVAKPTLLITNVSVFPWNAIYLDGKRVPCGDLFPALSKLGLQWSTPEALAVRVGPGPHVLRYAFRPERPWLYLRGLSWLVLAAWMAGLATVIGANLRLRNPPNKYTPYSATDAPPESAGVASAGTR